MPSVPLEESERKGEIEGGREKERERREQVWERQREWKVHIHVQKGCKGRLKITYKMEGTSHKGHSK